MIVRMSVEGVKKRFYNNIIKQDNGCWEWNKSRLPRGYGQFRVLGERLAHRVSFILHHGPILENAYICHKCDNPPCVNPDHLFMGTHQMNTQDCVDKGRTSNQNMNKTHCMNGHEFNEVNTYFSSEGVRSCRICSKNYRRMRRAKGLI